MSDLKRKRWRVGKRGWVRQIGWREDFNKMVTLLRDLRRQLAFLTWTVGSVFPSEVVVICYPYLDDGSALLTSEANMQMREIMGYKEGI